MNYYAVANVSFANNVPDPDTSGKELPTFKFALEKSEGKVIGQSSGKEATVVQLPISKGLAGVSMRIEPGAMRELHWHATAAEWAYVLEGTVRTTVIDADGASETDDFDTGEVWYFPRGHAHMIECLGDTPCHFILIFDNGYFSEFGTFSITDWLGHAPADLLAKNLGISEEMLIGLRKDEAYFSFGEKPPSEIPKTRQTTPKAAALAHKYRLSSQEPHSIHKGGREWRVDSSNFPISQTMTGVVLELEPGGLRELHWHPTSSEWQYVISGSVRVTLFGSHGRFRTEILEAGDVGYIPQGYGHSIENIGDLPCKVLLGFNTGIYAAIDLSTWLATNPADVLSTNLEKPKDFVERLPRDTVFIADRDGN